MSLLNQVLQDLQARQAPNVNTAQTTLRDVRIPPRGAPQAARRPWVLWTAIVLLSGISGSLLWQRSRFNAAPLRRAPIARAATRPAPPSAAAAGISATAPAPVPTTIPARAITPLTVAAPPVAAHAPAAAPVSPASAPRAAAVAVTTPPATQKIPTARPPPAGMSGLAPRAVEKTIRPLSPEQQAELTYQDAVRLLQSGRPSAAEPRLRAALDSYPAHRAARTVLAGLLINTSRLTEALQVLGAGLALAPSYAPFAKLYARLRIDQGDLNGARAVLERAAPTAQDDPEYLALLAALYQRLGLYNQAAETYRGALQTQPRNGVLWLGLGLALENAGDRADALMAYQRAQQSGTLAAEILRYIDGRVAALQSGHGGRR